MTKRLLIAGAGPNQIRIIEKAREMGLWVCAVDGNPDAPGLQYGTASAVLDIRDPEALLSTARGLEVDGIYPAAELSVEAVANACTTLGLPGILPEVAVRVRDKSLMRACLQGRAYAAPEFRRVESPEAARAAADAIGYPVVVKPVDGNSSKGVLRIDSGEAVEAAAERALSTSRRGAALVEAFLEGDEYCVDGLMFDGAYYPGGVTGKERSLAPYCFDTAIFMPGARDTKTCATIEACAVDALDAVGFTTGTTHVEIMMTTLGPQVIEIAGRPGGGRIPTDLIPIAYGTDFIADSIRVALGEKPVGGRTHERGAALRWLDSESGRVARIEGETATSAMPGVLELVVSVGAGDLIEDIVDCVTRDRVGYVLTEGDSGGEALERARDACARCRIVLA